MRSTQSPVGEADPCKESGLRSIPIIRAVMRYGYGRVSTIVQDTALQEDAFKRAEVDQVITEKWSSVGTRPKLQQLLARLGPGDELVVYKLDRLGRSLQDLLAVLDRINAAGAAFRSLTEPIDTRTPAGKLMYSMLGAVAEFERTLIRERAVAGQIAAYRRGVRWGGETKRLSAEDERELALLKRDYSRVFTVPMLADMFGVSHATVWRSYWLHFKPEAAKIKPRMPVLGRYVA